MANKRPLLPKLESSLFVFENWSLGLYPDGDGNTKRKWILSHAIGWCDGTNLPVRPRTDTVAIMYRVNRNEDMGFYKAYDDLEFWIHMNRKTATDLFNLNAPNGVGGK